MQRYMNGMSNGGSISWDGNTPLGNSELAAMVPAIFATSAHESRSDRFVPIATSNVLEGLRAADFFPVFAQQAKTRIEGKENFTRHMLRLRHKSLKNSEGEAFEVILTNANDGTASYKMIPGIFRFVCLNGLMTGETFGETIVRHSGKEVIENVRNGALAMLEQAPRVLEAVAMFKGIRLDRDEALILANAAHRVRFDSAYVPETDRVGAPLVYDHTKAPVEPLDLLRKRRTADSTPTLWTAYNIIQENCEKGGQRGFIQGANGRTRRAKVREVKGIAQKTALNQALWDMTEQMAKLKG